MFSNALEPLFLDGPIPMILFGTGCQRRIFLPEVSSNDSYEPTPILGGTDQAGQNDGSDQYR